MSSSWLGAHMLINISNLGQIKPGMTANLAVWDVASPGEIVYPMGFNTLTERIYEGQISTSPVH